MAPIMRKSVLLSLSVALALSACGGESAPPATAERAPNSEPAPARPAPVTGPRITGTVQVANLTSLPGGMQLVIKLLDVTDPAAVPVVVSEVTMPAPRMLPYSYELGYDPARIVAENRYVVEAALQADGLALYGTTAPTPALTQGAGDRGLALSLVQGGKAVAQMAPADQLKADFAALEANLGALRRITGERLEEQIAVGWDAFVAADGQVRMAREQVDYAEAGSAEFRYAYQGGQPWVVERKQGGVTTLVGWSTDGTLLLNQKGGDEASEEEIQQLRQRAAALYTTAAARR